MKYPDTSTATYGDEADGTMTPWLIQDTYVADPRRCSPNTGNDGGNG